MNSDAKLLLDCSSYDSVLRSLSNIFQVAISDFESLLKSIGSIPRSEEPKSYINQFVLSKISTPLFPISCKWFHATRVIEPNCFLREGIFHKKMIYPKMYTLLLELSNGMANYGENPFIGSINGKNSINDEGPFAFLCKTVATSGYSFNHAYYECPEIVEDISGSLLGNNCSKLIDKFKSLSHPCLVTFKAKCESYTLESAIYYAYLLITGREELESAEQANTCYDGNGLTVPPADIIQVDLL
jgi:hypothetical protein